MPARSPSVAVVIPAYNAGSTLRETLRSVVNQTTAPAEVVVVDDGSNDNSLAVAREFVDELPLTVIAQANAGPAAARRAGLAATKAEYIALLDSDDIWLSDHLQLLMSLARPGAIVSGDAWRLYPTGELGSRAWTNRFPVPPLTEQPLRIVRKNFVFVGSVFPRQAAMTIGSFRDGFSGAEDWDLWIRLIRSGLRVVPTGRPTVHYRINATGLTAGNRIYDVYVRVLEAAVEEAANSAERAAAAESLRWYRARRHLAAAFDQARCGNTSGARRSARAAFDGSASLRMQAACLGLSPRLTTTTLDRLRRHRHR